MSSYLERDRIELREWSAGNRMAFEVIHTSGDAHKGDLARMVEALAPKSLIPIHTFHPDAYVRFGAPVLPIPNGAWAEM